MSGTVHVYGDAQQLYSMDTPGQVLVEADAGPLGSPLTLAYLCDPTTERLSLAFEDSAIGCADEGTVTTWVAQLDEPAPFCGAADSPEYGSGDAEASDPQDSVDVFEGVGDGRCEGLHAQVTLELHAP